MSSSKSVDTAPNATASSEAVRESIRIEVVRRGMNPTAKALGTSRHTLGAYLAGVCREGTKLLLEHRQAARINAAREAA